MMPIEPDDFFGFALAEKTVVHEDANEPISNRPMHERRRDRRVDPAGERANHPFGSDSRCDRFHFAIGEALHAPVGVAPANAKEKISQDLAAARGVCHLGMKLQPKPLPRRIPECGNRRVRAVGDHLPVRRRRFHLIPVAHPHALGSAGAEPDKEILIVIDQEIRRTVLAARGAGHMSARELAENSHAVANAEHGTSIEQRSIDPRRALVVDARRASRKDDSLGRERVDLFLSDRERMDFAVHARLAHAAGDQLRVLAPEIEDENHSTR